MPSLQISAATKVNLADGFWVATFHTGLPQRVTASLGIWALIRNRLHELDKLAWLQTDLNVTLHYTFPAISVNGVVQAWPRRWVIRDMKPVCVVTLASTPSESPSPERLFTALGIDVLCANYRARVGYKIFPDGTLEWVVIRDVTDEETTRTGTRE